MQNHVHSVIFISIKHLETFSKFQGFPKLCVNIHTPTPTNMYKKHSTL